MQKVEMKLKNFLIPHRKSTQNGLKTYMFARLETIKLSEEKLGRALPDINHRKIIFYPPPREMKIKTQVKNVTYLIYKLLHSKGNYQKMKRKLTE